MVMILLPPPIVSHNGVDVDSFNILLPLEITHGRSGIGSQPDAPTAEFTWEGATCPLALNDEVNIDAFVVNPATGLYERVPRFNGKVSTVSATEAGGDVRVWSVSCIGNLADLGRVQVDQVLPEATEASRVDTVATAALGSAAIVKHGTTTKVLLQNGVDRDALSILHEIAAWCSGLVWEGRDGSINYGHANHRATEPSQVLPASSMADGVDWQTDRNAILNHVVVTYGDPETQNTYSDPTSISEYGFRHVEISTKLKNQSDADEFGQTVLIRRKEPYWVISDLVWDSSLAMTDDAVWSMNSLDIGDGVTLAVPPEPGPVGATPDAWTVEGWVETWDQAGVQRFQIAVSDRRRWGAYALRRWSQMAEETWQHWVNSYTWLGLLTAPVA